MENVKVYRLNEMDAVAAESLEDAKAFYLQTTGMSPEDAFDPDYDGDQIGLNTPIRICEVSEDKVALREIIAESWVGKPFIAVTFDS